MVDCPAKVNGKWQAKFQRRSRYRVTSPRPSGLPNLPFPLFHLSPPLLSCFPSPFLCPSPFFFSFFPHFFQQFSFTFTNCPAFSSVFGSKRRVSVRLLCQQCAPRGTSDTQDATCCGRGFLHISRHFRHVLKKRVLIGETLKKKGFQLLFNRTLSFFCGKSDVFETRKTKNFT